MITEIYTYFWRMKTRLVNFYHKCTIPFVIIHLRWIQYRYRKITLKNAHNQSNQVLAKLRLLQAKEQYYYDSFSAWGKYHPSCVWGESCAKFFKWLFPKKNFEEFICVTIAHPTGTVVYHNFIWDLIYKRDKKNKTYPGNDGFAEMIKNKINKNIDHQTMKPEQYRN